MAFTCGAKVDFAVKAVMELCKLGDFSFALGAFDIFFRIVRVKIAPFHWVTFLAEGRSWLGFGNFNQSIMGVNFNSGLFFFLFPKLAFKAANDPSHKQNECKHPKKSNR